ncbi:hypothetical protein AcW1_002714 [Taiwanofungus camphoratus]|nr:hypothetical protein AcW1_002714 [Antrodia cinnamomea]
MQHVAHHTSEYHQTYQILYQLIVLLVNILTHVFEYDEDSINPPDIVRGDFFSRPSFFNHKKRTLDPKIGSTTCFCYQPYNPFPTCTLSSDDSMHFCSRKDCLRWYHTSCLVKRGFVDPQFEVYQGTSDLQQLTADSERDLRYQGDRGLRLLAVDPGSDAPCILLQYFVEPAEEALKVEHASACSDSDSGRGSSPLSDLPLSMQPLTVLVTLAEALQVMSYSPTTLAHLPPALLRIAQFPIVRRPAPPDSDCSPIGNVNEVVLARRFVYAAFEGARPDGEWAHAVEHLIKQVESIECGGRPKLDGLMNGNAEHEAKNEEDLEDEKIEVLQSIVERLTEDILLASPYLPYWEQRARELEKEELEMGPPLVCPNCLGAI